MADPYTALGASPGATDEELRQQYLALTRQYPPEQHPERFAKMRAAYEAIKDIDARAKYALFDEGADDTIDQILEELACRTTRRRITLTHLLNSLPPTKR